MERYEWIRTTDLELSSLAHNCLVFTLGNEDGAGLLQGDAAEEDDELRCGCAADCCAGGVSSFASRFPSGEVGGRTAGDTAARALLFV